MTLLSGEGDVSQEPAYRLVGWKQGDIESAHRFAWKQYQVMMDEPPPKAWDFTPVDAMADRRVERKKWQQLRAWANGKRI